MFAWVTTDPSQDPLASTSSQQAMINYCGANGCNVVWLDMWNYLGDGNASPTKLALLRQFLDGAHRSGIKVYALAGNYDWAINQSWVNKNIVQPVNWFQAQAATETQKFDGLLLDVEYWTDVNQQASVSCPKLCDLMRSMRKITQLPIGCVAAFYLKDSNGSRASFSYQGKTAQDGEFLMDNADFVFVGAYRNAADTKKNIAGQKALFQPWYNYASQVSKNDPLFCGSLTVQASPSYTTYYGKTKTYMEGEHTKVSNQFLATNMVFSGQAINNYDGWKAMAV
jgi:hypothetical protein